jgi:hypothetical protein
MNRIGKAALGILPALSVAHTALAADEVNVSTGGVAGKRPCTGSIRGVFHRRKAGGRRCRNPPSATAPPTTSPAPNTRRRSMPTRPGMPRRAADTAPGRRRQEVRQEPQYWTVRDGKLYLVSPPISPGNSPRSCGNIRKAEKNWKSIEHKTVGSL